MIEKEKTAIRAVQIIAENLERNMNDCLKSKYVLFCIDMQEHKGITFAHTMYKSRVGYIDILIIYMGNMNYIVLAPSQGYETNDLVDVFHRAKVEMIDGRQAVGFQESDVGKFILLTHMAA